MLKVFLKRILDIFLSIIGIVIFIIPIVFLILLSTFFTKEFGLFTQKRIGFQGKVFIIYKIKSMSTKQLHKHQLSAFGNYIRAFKLDELPQLFNVLKGEMSIVGPRPDLIGYADQLKGEDRIILAVKPGLTSPATLLFANEERILAKQKHPQKYNDEVLWPQKVALNKKYAENWSLLGDLKIIALTVLGVLRLYKISN